MNSETKPKATILDLDTLMDMKMDEVETLPDYQNPPPGLYFLDVKDCAFEKYEMKDENKKPTGQKATRIRTTYSVAKTEAVMEGEMPVPDGTLFSETFMGTEQGLEFFKKSCMNILGVKDFEGATIKDVVEGVKGTQFKARLTTRKTPGEGGRVYENLTIRAANPVVAYDKE